eukprot:gene15864-20276_t
MASMVAHRLIIGDGRSQEIGRFTAIAASLIVIATAGTLLLGSSRVAEIKAPSRTSRPLLGVLFMCTACALFPIMNGLVKLLAATYDPQEIVWFRIILHLVLVAAVFMPRMGLGLLRTRRIGTQFVSSVMMMLSTLFFFSA